MSTRRFAALDLAALAATLAAFALRSFHVAHYGLNGDEALGAVLVYRGLDAIVSATTSGDPHPPLYYTMLKGWVALAGDSELAMRFLGLAAGVLLIPVTYRLGRWLFPGPGPLVAAIWLAVHPYQLWYAHEARMYLPIALFAALSTALLVGWLRRPTPGLLAGYVVATALALYTHYYATFLVVFQNLFVLGFWASARLARSAPGRTPSLHLRPRPVAGGWEKREGPYPLPWWLAAQLALLACFLPWLILARDLVRSYNSLGWVGPLPVIAETLVRFSVGQTWDWPGNVAVGAGFALLGALGIATAFQGSRSGSEAGPSPWPCAPGGGSETVRFAGGDGGLGSSAGWLLLGWALFPAAVGFVASFFRPMLTPRYLMVSAAAFALALGLGVAAAWRWRRLVGAAALVGVLLVSGRALANLYFDPSYARSGYDRLARYLADHGRPGDAILVASWTQKDMFWYYYEHRLGGKLKSYILPASDPLDPVQTMADVDRIMAEHAGAWFLAKDVQRYDPQRVIERQLATRSYKVLERWFIQDRLVYYASAAKSPDIPRQTVARFGDGVVLAGASLAAPSVRPGEAALVGLLWQTSGRLTANYKVSTLLKDPAGHVLAAVDREPADGFLPTSAWEPGQPVRDLVGVPISPSAVPGEYAVVAKLYDPATGQPLPAVDARGATLPDGAVVGRLKVDGPPAPSVAEPGPSISVGVDFGPLRLVGYDPPPDVEFVPGQPVGLQLYWQPGGPLPDTPLRFDLIDQAGKSIGSAAAALAPAWYPADRWESGRVLGVYTEFVVPPRTPTGRYQLRLAAGPGRPVGLSSIRVLAPPRDFSPPAPEHHLGARFGDLAVLAGYDGPAPGAAVLRPGESLRVVLRWQAVGESDVSYKVFAHLVGPDGKLHGQRDAPPLGGLRPTTGWVRGESLADPYEVPLAADAPAGAYVLKVGLYEEASGRRLPVAGGSGDSVDVLTFQVAGR